MGKFIRMQYRTLYQRIIRKLRPVWERIMGAPNFSIIVFQMGKVGSKTVEESLIRAYKKNWQPVNVYHSHILCGFDEAERNIRNERPNPEPSLIAIENGRKLVRLIEKKTKHQWKIISLVRDPVARNIATFFENLHEFVPDWQQQDQDDPLFMQKLQQTFLNIQTIHSEPYRWFDEQLLPMFGIDVFSEVFPHEVGYKIYVANSRLSLLIIRLEDLSRIGSVVIKQFLKLEDFELFNTNIGEDKKYANLYRKFKQQPLPSEYLHKIYKTKYAKTFYSKVELEEFEKQWLQIPSQNRKAIDYPKLNTAPILIYQMGKVGSVTIQASLEKAYQDMKVYTEIKRIHLMNLSVDDAKELLKYEYVKLDKTLGAIKNGLELRETIDANPQKKWKLISLVREPVGRNVATFFQSLEEFVPDWEERLASNSLTAKELQEIFLSKETLHRGPHQWFDNELKAVFNINVYDISFPMERGYKIYATEYHHPLLIMRLENLNSYAKEALERFLGLRNIKLISTNIGGNKPYAKLYQEFKDLPLPLTYVEKMYNTKYARHFYSDSELEDFMKKWTRR